jgi:Sterile alpha motif (SAM)/Pointed domain
VELFRYLLYCHLAIFVIYVIFGAAFRKEQELLKMPTDPAAWSLSHVMHWLRWAVKTFTSASIEPRDWEAVNGRRLCELSHDEFKVRGGQS